MQAVAGGLLGGIGGALGNQKEGGRDTGNIYNTALSAMGGATRMGQDMQQGLENQGAVNQDPNAAASEVQNSSILGGTFGKGGTLDQTRDLEKQQSTQPWALTDQDRSAYGQASGDIARQFGQSDQSMSQALSDRGLSNSGAAGAAFSGAQGNKQEQLAGLQTQIANNRMQMNQAALNSTRSFLGTLGGQANQAIGNQASGDINRVNQSNQAYMNKFNMASGLLGNYQDQQNAGLQQQQQTQHDSTFSKALNGGMSGAMTAGGMSGGGGNPKQVGQPGQSDINNNMFAATS